MTMTSKRSGITLTEILIAILIMGVGLVSLATLFPLGLLRAQRALRDSRSTLLAESAISEVGARNLLNYESFYFSQWYNYPNPPNANDHITVPDGPAGLAVPDGRRQGVTDARGSRGPVRPGAR